VFKLLQAAEGRWRAVNGPHLVALVRAGARFEGGKLIERPDHRPDKEADQDLTKVAA
jgi:putative transposase